MVRQKMQSVKIVPSIEKCGVIVIAANRVYANIIFLKRGTNLSIGNIHRFRATETHSKITDNQDISARYSAVHRISDKPGQFAVNVPANPQLSFCVLFANHTLSSPRRRGSPFIIPSSSPRFSPSFPCLRGGSRLSSASWSRASRRQFAWNRHPCTRYRYSARTTGRELPQCVCCRR